MQDIGQTHRLTVSFKTYVLIICVAIGVGLCAPVFLLPSNPRIISPLPDKPLPTPVMPTPAPAKTTTLETVVKKTLANTRGTYAIAVKHLKTGEQYFLNNHISFETASLYKLWIMAEVFEQIRDGKLKEDTMLTQDIAVLNRKFNIASESAELTEGTIRLSVRDALSKMITVSDNYTALLLSERVRLSNVGSLLDTYGYTESKLGTLEDSPVTTASDMLNFFDSLSARTLVNTEYSDEMIALLQKQTLNNKIPKYFPDGIVVAHKTGELGSYTHDAGIVYTNGGQYIIVILSKSDDLQGAEERIARVSQAVYEYFTQ